MGDSGGLGSEPHPPEASKDLGEKPLAAGYKGLGDFDNFL